MIYVVSAREYNYESYFSIAKDLWDTLEKIYEVLTEIKREMMNTLDQEYETPNKNEENL